MNLTGERRYRVFLNHPFDDSFQPLSIAMRFAVTAAGLVPVSALDLSEPDRPRLETLMEAITQCHFSAHDFSRPHGEGSENLARLNMPLEMGMALFHALQTQRQGHRCVFFVADPYEYQRFVSDLSGLDPKPHSNDEKKLLSKMYEWLCDVGPREVLNVCPSVDVVSKFCYFESQASLINGSGAHGQPTLREMQELMYQVCGECGWWDWRATKSGQAAFPEVPLSWKSE